MQEIPQIYSMDKVIGSFHMHDDTRELIYRHSSGNGGKSRYRDMRPEIRGGFKQLNAIFDGIGVNKRWFRQELRRKFLCDHEDKGLTENYGNGTKVRNGNVNRVRKLLWKYIVSVEDFNGFIADGIESAEKLNGEVYSARQLIKMRIPCLKTRKKLSGYEAALYLNAVKQDWNKAPETGTLCHSHTDRFLSWLEREHNRKRQGMTKKGGEYLSIDQIWGQFHKTYDVHFRNLLMEHYRSLVRYCAERLHSKVPDKVELDDLIGAGIFGLMDAIDDYDPDRGVKFETYCQPRIRGSILDELRSMDWVPRLVRARAHQLAKATRSLEMNLGRKPSEKEIAKELGMDMKEFGRLQRDANAGSMISLDAGYDDGNSEKDVREIDTIKDPYAETPLAEFQKKSLKDLLTRGLTRGERLVVILYYYEGMTMKEIGGTLDLSESRVSQMHSSIIAGLKARMTGRKEEYLMTH